mmetsp:Transcript_66210/g.197010  ORF Transcript_66210/g.197010 Transcript_66210/m.197010 type:complete len:118 (+) Transcript_66210:48-401(+)
MFSGISSFARSFLRESDDFKTAIETDSPPVHTRRMRRSWTDPSKNFKAEMGSDADDHCHPSWCRGEMHAASKDHTSTALWARCDKSIHELARERAEVLAHYSHGYDRYRRRGSSAGW